MPVLTIRFTQDEYAALVRLSQETQIPRGSICRAAIKPILKSADSPEKQEPPKAA
ncbi:hypothetical protein [Leptolyngbya sp. FACHB-36]|uniref:hypothetical protein n=1 Tax=Leptolyngbya sp. FACHB-36 TaxID=2692808 RepID=UPI001680119E|nr:hypothetical protein [Leptolyngbya sp. FACHB-36]